MGKLSSAECVRFEEHLVDCPECQKQLETTADFRQALKTVTREDATRSHMRTTPALSFWPAAASWQRALIAAAACFIILAAPAVRLIRQTRLAHAELNQPKTASETWPRQ